MSRRLTWCRRALGRRGAALLMLGTVWVLQGVGIALSDSTVNPDAMLLHERLPLWIRAGLWLGTGTAALVYAWRRSPGADTPGFLALVVLPLERACSYALGWGWFLIAGPAEGYPLGWAGALIWLVFSGLIILIAGWPEPESAPPLRGPQ